MRTEVPLTYEQFIQNDPLYGGEGIYHPLFNNFANRFRNDESLYGYIRRGGLADLWLYKFIEEHPDLDEEMRQKLEGVLDSIASHSEVFPDLYRAYLVMREYVEDDSILFR